MKSSIFHLVSLFAILAFTASCGKSGSGGGGGNNNQFANGYNASGTVAQSNLLAWYNSTGAEGSLPNPNTSYRLLTKTEKNASNGCSTQPVSVFGFNLTNINLCTSGSGLGSGTQIQVPVHIYSNGDKKSGNSELVTAMSSIVNGGAGPLFLTNITQAPSTQTTGSVFTINLVDSNQKKVVYVIDTGLNSKLNPVYVLDGVAGKERTLTAIMPGLNQ